MQKQLFDCGSWRLFVGRHICVSVCSHPTIAIPTCRLVSVCYSSNFSVCDLLIRVAALTTAMAGDGPASSLRCAICLSDMVPGEDHCHLIASPLTGLSYVTVCLSDAVAPLGCISAPLASSTISVLYSTMSLSPIEIYLASTAEATSSLIQGAV